MDEHGALRVATGPKSWTQEEAVAEYHKMVSALQYTIGERERLKVLWRLMSLFIAPHRAVLAQRIMRLQYSSKAERYQDIFAMISCGGKEGGYFVEYGACDGIVASNTFALERDFGWNGILAEPATFWHEGLRKNRTAKIDTRCVSGVTGQTLELHESKTKVTSSLYKDHEFLGEVSSSYTVETVSLTDLLKDHKDFLTIDCEGHEKASLENFDFAQYRFGFVCVEQHASVNAEKDVIPLFEAAGYKVLFPRHADKSKPPHMQISGIDLYFVDAKNPILEKVGA
jgi:FkbM family methyltransferase